MPQRRFRRSEPVYNLWIWHSPLSTARTRGIPHSQPLDRSQMIMHARFLISTEQSPSPQNRRAVDTVWISDSQPGEKLSEVWKTKINLWRSVYNLWKRGSYGNEQVTESPSYPQMTPDSRRTPLGWRSTERQGAARLAGKVRKDAPRKNRPSHLEN